MNIAIISNFSNFMKESINITTFEFAKELKRLGNNVFIVSNAGKEKRYKEVEGVKIFIEGKRCNKSFLNPIYIYEQLFIHKKIIQKILKKERIDIIHHFSASPILLLRALIAFQCSVCQEIEYRGHKNRLWKNNFLKLFLERHPDLKITKQKIIKYLENENIDEMFLLEKT